MTDLPDGMVTIGEALAGFLTELEERCKQQEGGKEWQTRERTPNSMSGI